MEKKSQGSAFVVTFCSVLSIGLLKLVFNQLLFIDNPYLLFFSAIVISAIYGGFFHGFLATTLVLVFAEVFFPYGLFHNFERGRAVQFFSTFIDGLLISFICHELKRINFRRIRIEDDLAETNKKLELGVAQRTKELTDTNLELKKLVYEKEKVTDDTVRAQVFLNSVIEYIPNMIFVKDAKELRFVRLNRAGENLVGQPRERLIGKSDYDFFPKEQADFFTEKDREVLQGKTAVDIAEEPIQTPSGIRYLHTKKIPILNKDGEPEYLLGISEDITEKKAAEQQKLVLVEEKVARVEAERMADYFSFLSRASVSLNESLDIQTMLTSFAEVILSHLANCCDIKLIDSQGNSETIVNLYQNSFKSVAFKKNFFDTLGKTIIDKTIRTGEYFLYTSEKRNEVRTLVGEDEFDQFLQLKIGSFMVVPIKAYSKVYGVLTLISLNSSHLYGDFDLSLAQELAKRASLAIENARLFAKAQEASLAKSAFLANMSHEIRTPLGAVLGFADLLSMGGNLSPDQNQFLATIRKNGKQLLKIVDEILDLSKVETDRLEIEKIEFSVPQFVEEITSLLNIHALEKKLGLFVKIPFEVPEKVITDPTRLRQILINVIGNAIKFTEKGHIDIHVYFRPLPSVENRGHLEFVISDTGIGITESQHHQLFQPFAQADSSMTRRFGGTGLGLFLSRKLARLLGGDLILKESSFGEGSKFILTVEVETAFREEEIPIKFEQKETKQELKPRVLVVDDAEDNRLLMNHYLAKIGLEIDNAENGYEGMSKALENDYDLVLMDIQMPVMDGFEAIKKMRAHHYRGKVVALTAHAMKGDREKCLSSGFDDYLCKPLNREDLERVLKL